MPAFIWHIDGAAVIFDWEFADLWEASGCCLFRQVFTDCRWRLLGLQVKAARLLVESSECGMLKGKEMGVLSKHGLGHKRLDTL